MFRLLEFVASALYAANISKAGTIGNQLKITKVIKAGRIRSRAKKSLHAALITATFNLMLNIGIYKNENICLEFFSRFILQFSAYCLFCYAISGKRSTEW
jgi:hypothetical protein